jgi:hypothetical protein
VSFSGRPVVSLYLFILLTVNHDGDDVTMDVADDTREYPCIIRATDGKDVSFSTHVRTFL